MKKLKKYLFDLLILFIGITLAFYVENYRQDMQDKQDLQKYFQGLLDDLKSDSLIYASSEVKFQYSLQRLDSLLQLVDNYEIEDTLKIRLLAKSTLLIYDIGIENNTNYRALINSGQLKLISDIVYRKELKDYYRRSEVWLKNYENEFQVFRTNELYPFLNSQIDFGDFRWDNGFRISETIRTETDIFSSRQFKNYLHRTRQFLSDFRNTMSELSAMNQTILTETRKKLK